MVRTNAATVTFGIHGNHIIPAGHLEAASKTTTTFALSNWSYAKPATP